MHKRWTSKNEKWDFVVDINKWIIGLGFEHRELCTEVNFLCFSLEYWRNY